MAIFTSATLGSSDPSRAMSIKALEARAQALAAAQAKQEMPTSLPSPWQGAALVANQAVDAFTARQADRAAAQRRSDLAGYMAQAGDNPTPQQLGQITAADSDVGKTYMQEIASRRAAAAQVAAAKEAAATKAASDEAAAAAQEGRLAARPKSPLGMVTADIGRKPTEEEAQAEIKKMTQGSPSDQAAMGAARDENVNLQTTAAKLAEADQLLTDGIYHGVQAGNKAAYGQAVPDVLHGVTGIDDATTARSKRYNQIMSSEVVAQLKAIKGPASNKDMEWALSTVNDASAPKENKQRAMTILRAQMDAHLRSSEQTLKGMGTAPVKVDIPAAGAPAAGAAAADPMEGRTIVSDDGKTKMIRRSGKWEPM
jgi:hypothetical protein